MPELVKIRPELFPSLYDAFLRDDDPLSDEQDWRNVFNYQWERDEDHTGYALMENDRVIGMMAMAFSTRLIDGRSRKFCNLHTWWVHQEHRGRSLVMLKPLLAMKDYTITHFTPCDRIRALTKRLGFVDLDLQMKLLLPLGPFRSALQADNAVLRFDGDIDSALLSEHDRRIYRDHLPYRVGNLTVSDGDGSLYVLYTCVERYRVRYCHVHYFSHKHLYARHEHAIRNRLMRRHGVRFVVVDSRLVKDLHFQRGFDFWAPAHAVYRPSGDVPPEHVDNLYSDVVMLRLANLPSVKHELKEIVRRRLPGERRTAV